jgi:transposase-like protein
MPEYSAAFKARVVKRLVGPEAVGASQLAEAVGGPQPTLSRWVRELRSVSAMPRRPGRNGPARTSSASYRKPPNWRGPH